MPRVSFINEVFDKTQEEYLHSFDLNKNLLLPNVGDTVDFDDDSFYEKHKRDTCGTRFKVIKKTIHYSRADGCRDDCWVQFVVINSL